jgi:hypothetical protein
MRMPCARRVDAICSANALPRIASRADLPVRYARLRPRGDLLRHRRGALAAGAVRRRHVRRQPRRRRTPLKAAGANIPAFNVGNALGEWLGGLAIGAGWYVSPFWICAGIVADFRILGPANVSRPVPTSTVTAIENDR